MTPTVIRMNGVNVDALTQATNAIKETPQLASFEFRTTNESQNGGHNPSTAAADAEQLRQFMMQSPVFDIVTNPVPVRLDIRVEEEL